MEKSTANLKINPIGGLIVRSIANNIMSNNTNGQAINGLRLTGLVG